MKNHTLGINGLIGFCVFFPWVQHVFFSVIDRNVFEMTEKN